MKIKKVIGIILIIISLVPLFYGIYGLSHGINYCSSNPNFWFCLTGDGIGGALFLLFSGSLIAGLIILIIGIFLNKK